MANCCCFALSGSRDGCAWHWKRFPQVTHALGWSKERGKALFLSQAEFQTLHWVRCCGWHQLAAPAQQLGTGSPPLLLAAARAWQAASVLAHKETNHYFLLLLFFFRFVLCWINRLSQFIMCSNTRRWGGNHGELRTRHGACWLGGILQKGHRCPQRARVMLSPLQGPERSLEKNHEICLSPGGVGESCEPCLEAAWWCSDRHGLRREAPHGALQCFLSGAAVSGEGLPGLTSSLFCH